MLEASEIRGGAGARRGGGKTVAVGEKVVVAFERYGPYHWARVEAAARRLPVVALEFDPDDRTYAWERCEPPAHVPYLSGRGRDRGNGAPRGGFGLDEPCAAALAGARCLALPGWSEREVLGLLAEARFRRLPVVLMSASTARDAPRVAWREAVKRRIVRMFDAALVGGRPQADYVAQLGMPRERIFLSCDVVDNAHFAAPAAPPRQIAGWNGRRFFLASARFIPVKNLPRLLEAFARYRALAGSEAWSLVVLGDGELRPALEEVARKLGLGPSLLMPGFKRYPELPSWYQAASCFVLASTSEPWGLVVNEAMAAGLPVLVSHRCGCAMDLVQDGVNGFTFDPLDVEQLARLMYRVAHGGVDRVAMGRASRRIIADWGPERFAQGLKAAVECALVQPRRPLSPLDRTLLWGLARR